MEKMERGVHVKYLTGLDIMGRELFHIYLLSVAKRYTLQMINESLAWADQLNTKHLVLHAGYVSMEDARDVLREIADDRLLIENMPKVGLNDEPMIGYSPAQIEELIGGGDRGLCLDLNHAAKAAVSLGVDYIEYVKEFLRFDPTTFHISDGKLDLWRQNEVGSVDR